MAEKRFLIDADDIELLVTNYGGCFATDRITVDGAKVGFCYREAPDNDADSGWRFMAGDEDDAYMDDTENHAVYAVNTIANYDRGIIVLIDAAIGSVFERDAESAFVDISAVYGAANTEQMTVSGTRTLDPDPD